MGQKMTDTTATMPMRTLGTTGMQVSALALGATQIMTNPFVLFTRR
jgi:hypothetical protein